MNMEGMVMNNAYKSLVFFNGLAQANGSEIIHIP